MTADQATPVSATGSGTRKVTVVEGSYHGIPLRFIDTPGLVPSADSVGHNERVLNQVRAIRSL